MSPFHQNIFGGTVGGPIFKNKLFFFGAFQGTKERLPSTASNIVYTPANPLRQLRWRHRSDRGYDWLYLQQQSHPRYHQHSWMRRGRNMASVLWPTSGGTNGIVPTTAFNSISYSPGKAVHSSPCYRNQLILHQRC